jgi:23S rRNA (cytidine1920-2'-O)/16S rRNA (cytidine1409-2'-O)-methyltransferase
LISAGQVRVNGVVVCRPSVPVQPDTQLTATLDPYVSRGAHKLIGALDDLGLQVRGRALDAGAATGGFTQVLLERGCSQVYAVDVGTAQLAPEVRTDPRVVVREQTNLRGLTLDLLDDAPVDLVVADLSFIPLTLVLDRLAGVARSDADVLLLVKPQFEIGRARLGKSGVVRDPALRREAVAGVAESADRLGWPAHRCVRSRVPGPAGNVEFFCWLRQDAVGAAASLLDGVDFA